MKILTLLFYMSMFIFLASQEPWMMVPSLLFTSMILSLMMAFKSSTWMSLILLMVYAGALLVLLLYVALTTVSMPVKNKIMISMLFIVMMTIESGSISLGVTQDGASLWGSTKVLLLSVILLFYLVLSMEVSGYPGEKKSLWFSL